MSKVTSGLQQSDIPSTPPALVMIDVLDYFVMADQSKKLAFSRETHHMEGNANPCYTSLWADPAGKPNKIWWIKDKAGNPWDVELVDDFAIYHWLTEWNDLAPNNFWAIPSNYKRFDSNGWPQVGVPIISRFLPPGMPAGSSIQIYTPASKGSRIKNCQFAEPGGVADILGVTNAPAPHDNGGDIPAETLTIIAEYRWGGHNGVYTTRERLFGALHYGLVAWDTSNLINGVFQVTQQTLYNKLVKGGCPKPIFPCKNP